LDREAEDNLRAALERQPIGPLSPTNFLKHALRAAINQGVPTNTATLILLLPLMGVIVTAFYYLIGLTGFGLFMPAMISVAFVATGVVGGLVLFGFILLLTLITRRVLRRFKLHLRSRRAITLWVVCLGTFGFLLLSSLLGLFDVSKISIFPILFLVLLADEFIRFHLSRSRKSAISLTLGTLVISVLGALLINWQKLQELVLLYPEISASLILLVAFLIGRYTGFRLLEYRRFKPVLRK